MINLAPISTLYSNQITALNGIPPGPVAGYMPPSVDPKAARKVISYAIRGIFHALLVPFVIFARCGVDPKVLLGYIKDLGNSESSVRRIAAEELGKMGSQATDAIPALTKALWDSNEEVRNAAAEALDKIGIGALLALTEALKNSDSNIRAKATYALGRRKEVGAVQMLIMALKDSVSDVRRGAAWALGEIGPSAVAAVPALITALEDYDSYDSYVRKAAAEALGNIGSNTPDVISALTGALSDSDESVREAAAAALKKIRGK